MNEIDTSQDKQSSRQQHSKSFLIAVPIILAWLLSLLGPLITNGFTGNFSDKLTQSIGAGLGLLIFATALAIPLNLCIRFFWRSLNKREFSILFSVCVLLIGVSTTIGHLYNLKNSSASSERQLSKQTLPVFQVIDQLDESINDNLYRNKTYRFRIRFPRGWTIMDGDGAHVVKKAELENVGSINITVRSGPEDGNSNDFSDIELMALGDLMIQPLLQKLGGSLLENRIVYINNQKAILLRMQVTYKRLSGEYRAINEQYVLINSGYLYLLTTTVRETDYSRLAKTLRDSVDTFVIEDWEM